jgi:ubiquinone/menaquinone biosynthesis C-methylase UbiE
MLTRVMSWLLAPIYDPFMRATEEACLHAWRRDLLFGLSGHVLEIGAGTGANLEFYPKGVDRIVALEPDPGMARRLRHKLAALPRERGGLRFEVVTGEAEALPFPSASFDAVVSTLVLCTVRDLDRTLSEIRRVLRPRGTFVFLEHVADERNPRRRAWQRRVEPIWTPLAGGCHLTRQTEAAIVRAGFEFEAIERESMRKAFPLVRASIRGFARPATLRSTVTSR